MPTLWRTFISYFCGACREDVSRKDWLANVCPHCGHTGEPRTEE